MPRDAVAELVRCDPGSRKVGRATDGLRTGADRCPALSTPVNFAAARALALLLLLAHAMGLLLARSFFDITVDISSSRQLILLFPLTILAMAGAFPRALLIPVLACLMAIHLKHAVHPPPVPGAEYNANHPDWRRSEATGSHRPAWSGGMRVQQRA